MASKKLIIGLVVVVIAVAAFIAIASSGSNEPDARLNYSYEVTDSYVADDGYVEHAYSGKTFVILTIVCANDHYSAGISTNDIIFQWKVGIDGMEYSSTIQGTNHPNYKLAEVSQGSVGSWTLVFSVPDTTTHDDVTISYDYVMFSSPTLAVDESLTL